MANLIQNVQRQSRYLRRPVHTFQIEHRPWQIAPFMIAPVVAGDTMRNLLLQCRSVTDPIQNALVGWHLEHYFFYVKLRDFDDRDALSEMMLDPTDTTTALHEAANSLYHQGWTTMPWTKKALKRIVEEWFRAKDEAWDAYTINGLPAASVKRDSLLDSMVTDAAFDALIPEQTLVVGGDDSFTMSELEAKQQLYTWQRENGLTRMDFEDWLATQGVKVAKADDPDLEHRPELLRFTRNWVYPSNTIDPSDGSPSSACSWAITERADKDRFFIEPGFIVGVSVARPKVYFKNLTGSGVGLMTSAKTFLPVEFDRDAYASFVMSTTGTGPVPSSTGSYWIDLRDLFMYGDQFVNMSLAAGKSGVALPTAALQKRYPASTDADGLFVDTTAGVGKVRQDGAVSLAVSSRLRDRSATV